MKKPNQLIAMSRKAYRSGKKPLGDISKKKQETGLKVSVAAEEDEQIGEEWFLHDHQKCIYCQSVSPPDFEELYKYNDFCNWPPKVQSSDVEPEEIADPEPKEMPYCDWLLDEKEMADRHRMRLDQRIAVSERMELEAEMAEMADRHQMKLEAEMADLEDQSPWKDEESPINLSPINFTLKEDLSP